MPEFFKLVATGSHINTGCLSFGLFHYFCEGTTKLALCIPTLERGNERIQKFTDVEIRIPLADKRLYGYVPTGRIGHTSYRFLFIIPRFYLELPSDLTSG
jgi:hypothetical protein